MLKGYPDHILSNWFELARRGLAGPLDGLTTTPFHSLQPSPVPIPIGQDNEDPEAIASTTSEPDTSSWISPPRSQLYEFEQAQHPFPTQSQLQSIPSSSTSPAGSDLYSIPTSAASFTSATQGDSPCTSTDAPVHIAPRPTISSNDAIDDRKHRLGGPSLSTFTRSSANSLSPTPHRTRTSALPYSCTFCDSQSTFKSKHEWKRHERSHVPQVEYICLPKGAVIPSDDRLVCAICGVIEPRADHMNEHKMHLCLYKHLEDRTYSRKDKFATHLRVHGLSLEAPQVKEWSRQLLPEKVLGCGFCVQYFENFEDRFQHVAEHFEQGYRKDSWSRSTVLLSLLAQPFISCEWQLMQGDMSAFGHTSQISWPESSSTESLQRRLENGTGHGRDLAVAAYNLSSLCSGQASRVDREKRMEASEDLTNGMSTDVDSFNHFQFGTMQH